MEEQRRLHELRKFKNIDAKPDLNNLDGEVAWATSELDAIEEMITDLNEQLIQMVESRNELVAYSAGMTMLQKMKDGKIDNLFWKRDNEPA